MYQEGELTLDGLEKKAPLIARAISGAGEVLNRNYRGFLGSSL